MGIGGLIATRGLKLGRTVGRITAATARSAYDHNCADAAAAMAFDFVFALFPSLLVLTTLLGILQIPVEAFEGLIRDLGMVVPEPLIRILVENLEHLSSQSLVVLGALGIFWPASASMSTTMTALTRAYGASETRGFWVRRGLSLVLVISLGLSLVFLFNFIAFSEQVEAWLARHWTQSSELPSPARILRRTAGMLGTLVVAAAIYRIAPDLKQRWVDLLPGSLLFMSLWSLIAGGFGYYIQNFGYYNLIYGVLGGVIVLLLSAYLVALTLLLGGELNASILRERNGRVISSPAIARSDSSVIPGDGPRTHHRAGVVSRTHSGGEHP